MKRLILTALVLAISAGPPIALAQTTPVSIDELPAAGTLTGTELLPAEQVGTAVAATVNQIRSFTVSNLPAISLSINGSGGISGILQVPNGGTGTSSLSGLLRGNGTSALSSATYADIQALFTGCGPGTYFGYGGLCSAPSSSGVSSVSFSAPAPFTALSSPSTGAASLSLTYQSTIPANQFFGSPAGATGAPSMRALLAADIPVINLAGTGNGGVSGTLPVNRGGTGATSLTGLLVGNGTGAFGAASFSNVIATWSGCTSPTTMFPRADGNCIAISGGGSITSVGLSAPSVFSVGNSPLTGSGGTLALTFATGQAANQVLASPNGTAGAFGSRALVGPDIPAINLASSTNGGVTGNLPVTNLGSGTGASSTTCWHGNATWGTCGNATSANPSATIGLTAVNGSAATVMTSDSAPALSQAIVPTWTALHTFSAGLSVGSSIGLKASGEIDANSSPGTLGQVLTSQGSGNAAIWSSVVGTSPGGATGDLQYKSGGAFGGASNFTYNSSTQAVSIGAPPGASDSLTVAGAANAAAIGILGSPTTGQSYGLYVQAGTNATDQPVQILNQAGTLVMSRIYGDGHGYLGPNSSSNLDWNTAGDYAITAPSSGTALTLYGAPTTNAALTIAGNSTTGGSFGELIAAGTNTSDYAFRVENAAQTAVFLQVNGAGNLTAPLSSASGIAFTAGCSSGSGFVSNQLQACSSGADSFVTTTDGTIEGLFGSDTTQMVVGSFSNHNLGIRTDNVNRIVVSNTGNVAIAAPASGAPLTITGISGSTALNLDSSSGAASNLEFGWNVGLTSNAWNLFSQSTDPLSIGTTGGAGLILATDDVQRLQINASGDVNIVNPNSGTAFTVAGASGATAAVVEGSISGGNGLLITAGTSSSNYGFAVNNAADTLNLFAIDGDGGQVNGAPTGGDCGFGCINAQIIKVQNVPVLTTSGNAATASALASTPSQCSSGQFATGVTATGAANCSTPPSAIQLVAYGAVSSTCSVSNNKNASCGSHSSGSGLYNISVSGAGFSSTPLCTANTGIAFVQYTLAGSNSTSVQFATYNTSGANTDEGFTFICVQ